jgi:hypothetical protein
MPHTPNAITVTQECLKSWRALLPAGKRVQYQKVSAAMVEAQTEAAIKSIKHTSHGESRLPDVEKFDLGDGYRLVTQRLRGAEGSTHYVFLFVGSHDEMEAWLNGHRNYKYVAGKKDKDVSLIPATTAGGVPPILPPPSESLSEPQLTTSVFSRLSGEDWNYLKVQQDAVKDLLNVTLVTTLEQGFDLIETMAMPEGSKSCLFDLLHCALNGDESGFQRRLELLRGEARVLPGPQISGVLRHSPIGEQFVTFDDSERIEEFRKLAEAPRWREWLTYLHPDQAHIVVGEYMGPARVRGVSGSGKTSVAVHRARFLARQYGLVFLVTYNYSLKLLLESLIRDLCGAELGHIQVFTIQELARRMFYELTGEGHPDVIQEAQRTSLIEKLRDSTQPASSSIRRVCGSKGWQYMIDELSFLRTRYSYADRLDYLSDDLTWRSSYPSQKEREDIYDIAAAYETILGRNNVLDPDGILLRCLELLRDRRQYATILPRCIVADEVQDFSQNELRLLASLVPINEPDCLFLVGDGTQRVYKRGFSFAKAGIDVAGRAFVLNKSYRNSRQIMDAAHNLVLQFTFPELDTEVKDKPLQPDYPAREGARPMLVKFLKETDEAAWIVNQVRELIEAKTFNPGEILILSGTQRMRDEIRRGLHKASVAVCDLREDIEADSTKVKMSTIESAKGHESTCAFVAGLVEGAIPWLPVDEEGLRINASRLYVAMTRARDKLIMTWSTTNATKQQASPSRFLRMIQQYCDEYAWKGSGLVKL